jgi:hypothetical protein
MQHIRCGVGGTCSTIWRRTRNQTYIFLFKIFDCINIINRISIAISITYFVTRERCVLFQLLTGTSWRDRMVVGFTTVYAISAYHHWCCGVRISIGARCTTLSDKVCQWLATGQWFSPGPPVSSTNKTDRHDITEIKWR